MDSEMGSRVPYGESAPAGGPAPFRAQGWPTEEPAGTSVPNPADTTERAGERRGWKVGLWARLRDAVTGEHTLALIDQAVVSGTSFATTVLIGRWCGADALGVYALGASLLVTWACVQESLIALPYTIYWHRLRREAQAEYAGSVLVHQGLLSALAFVAMAATAAVLSLREAVPGLAHVTWVLAGVMPFVLLREFGRRFAFAHLRMAQALVLDLGVAAVQLSGLAWLTSSETLSAATACGAVGAACTLTGAIWLYLARGNFAIRWGQVGPTMRQSWSLGKWLFTSQLVLSVHGYFIHWLLALFVGATATGVYAACLTVVLFSNPLILGVSNALAARSAHAFSTGGAAQLWRVVFQTTVLLGTALALFCAAIFFAGEDVLSLLYHGSQYQGHGHTVAVLALAMLASGLGMPASNGLAAVERPDLIFKTSLFALGLSVVLIPCLVLEWDVTGAAYGFLAGNVVASAGRWAAFSAVVPQRGRAGAPATPRFARVTSVLQQFTQSYQDRGWVIERLSEGAQANIFVVRMSEGQPLWQSYRELVVKVFKPTARHDAAMVRDQFESMSQLHAKLDGRMTNGWKIHTPMPLYHCERPFALVMTRVPGRSLNACLKTADQATTEALESIADAVIAGMERYWTIDALLHGDLNFDNILCAPATKSLSFVDPGVQANDFLYNVPSRLWYPASRDLAHMLYETGAGVKKTLGNPAADRRQRSLVERVLRAFLKRIGRADQQRSLLDEIHACVQVHLASLRFSWSPRGFWRLFIRRTASRRIHEILERLRAETGLLQDGLTPCQEVVTPP